jgi:uncharacterized membrane protein
MASPTPTPPPPTAASSGMSSNVAGLLCYLLGLITGIIFLVIEPYKNDKFVRFHAFQSIGFSVVCIVFYWVVSAVFFGMLFSGGLGFFFMIIRLVQLAMFLTTLFLMYKAYNNEQFKLPVIGDFAAKQAGV